MVPDMDELLAVIARSVSDEAIQEDVELIGPWIASLRSQWRARPLSLPRDSGCALLDVR